MDEANDTGRLPADADGVDGVSIYAAGASAEYLEAVYEGSAAGQPWYRGAPVLAFTAAGTALVLDYERGRLVPAERYEDGGGGRFLRVQPSDLPPMSGPFTPAPAGMIAFFKDGSHTPVVFYDVLGRAVLMSDFENRELYLAESDPLFIRIDGGPVVSPPTTGKGTDATGGPAASA